MGEHLEDDAAEVSAEGADGLVVSLAIGAFFLVVALRLRDPFAIVIDGDHHRCLGAGVDMLWRLRATVLAGTVIERGHAEIQGQAGLASEPRDGADLAGQFGAADRAVARDGALIQADTEAGNSR